jgi:molybdopterin-guanine dinucleotide biosynthesis protein A
LSDDIVIVTNEPARYAPLTLPARFVPDEVPGVGSLMGIYSGLKVVCHTHALTVACDMPFLCLPLLRHMMTLSEGYDVVIPRLNGMLEPLHAIYDRTCLPFMAQLLDRGQRQIIAFFDEVRVRYVAESVVDRYDPQRLSFVNVNTPEDWKRVEALLSQPDPG